MRLDLDGVEKDLPVNDAYLLHRSDRFDPQREWELRGVKAHDVDRERLSSLREEAIKDFLNSSEFNPTIFDSVKRYFVELVEDPRGTIRKNFPDRQFYFVVGIPRSGGHYLLKNLLALEGLNLRNFVYGMISDFCPTLKSLLNTNTETGLLFAYFELAQMLAWMEDVYEGQDRLYKKKTGFSYVVSLLDKIFGDQATYLVTVRRPIPSLESQVEYDLGETQDMRQKLESTNALLEVPRTVVLRRTDLNEEQWQSLPVWKRHTLRWLVHYSSIVRQGQPEGELIPVEFGEGLVEYLEEFSGRIGSDVKQVDDFEASERGVQALESRDFVTETIERVRRLWSKKNCEFPDLTG